MLLCGTSSHRVDGVIEGSEGVAMIEVSNGDGPRRTGRFCRRCRTRARSPISLTKADRTAQLISSGPAWTHRLKRLFGRFGAVRRPDHCEV